MTLNDSFADRLRIIQHLRRLCVGLMNQISLAHMADYPT